MYGKGLYFADVTAKSVDYCGSPYQLKSTSVNKNGKTIETQRTVFYMLLCEVSTGDATELVSPTFSETIPEGIESVKALSTYVPDPAGWVVSPESGALLHLGKVGQVGVTVPLPVAWVKTEYNPQPTLWFEQQTTFTNETQQILNTVIETLSAGETYTVEDTKKTHFMTYAHYGSSKKITVELLTKGSEGSQVDTAGGVLDVGPYCDASVKVVFSGEQSTYSYLAKRYRNMFSNFPLERGYTLQPPNLADYSEYIVYNEAQARIRYLLEIEQG
jgi:hypothetical protein